MEPKTYIKGFILGAPSLCWKQTSGCLKLRDKNVSNLLSPCWSGRPGQHSEAKISVDLRQTAVMSLMESRVVTYETAQKKSWSSGLNAVCFFLLSFCLVFVGFWSLKGNSFCIGVLKDVCTSTCTRGRGHRTGMWGIAERRKEHGWHW